MREEPNLEDVIASPIAVVWLACNPEWKARATHSMKLEVSEAKNLLGGEKEKERENSILFECMGRGKRKFRNSIRVELFKYFFFRSKTLFQEVDQSFFQTGCEDF